jgi:LysM repeat protein
MQLTSWLLCLQAKKGDYAERVAQNFGIPIEQLLNASLQLSPAPAAAGGAQAEQHYGVPLDNPGAWLEGRLLKVCGAQSPAAADASNTSGETCRSTSASHAKSVIM